MTAQVSRRMVSALVVVTSSFAGTNAFAQLLPMCTANGLEVTGDTSGLSVEPCPQPKVMDQLDVSDAPLDPVQQDPPPGRSNSTLFWGYEANMNFGASRLIAYHAVPGSVVAPQAGDCVPSGPHIPVVSNGRGLAFDPLDGNLWISRLTIFTGDQRIHKVTPPNVTPGTCEEVDSLLVHYPGGAPPEQPAFGALDTDQGSKHIWAAGYGAVSIGGQLRNYFYLVNRNNGLIIQSCWIPAPLNPFQPNNSLSYARLPGLPGSGQYLITDNDELFNGSPLLVIDTADCHNGRPVTPVAQYAKARGMTGIDFEWMGLIYTEVFQFWNGGDQPFTDNTYLGLNGTSYMEDISVCGFRAKFGGDGNDGCPYP